jgi:hypothetical protein
MARTGPTPAPVISGTYAAKEDAMSEQKKHEDLEAAVVTTSGRWPATGFDKTAPNQKVRHVLDQAAKHLNLAATNDWIATVGTKTVNADVSFADNGFTTGEIIIDFGPRQGGGGRA